VAPTNGLSNNTAKFSTNHTTKEKRENYVSWGEKSLLSDATEII
jgi:hypothetical protein